MFAFHFCRCLAASSIKCARYSQVDKKINETDYIIGHNILFDLYVMAGNFHINGNVELSDRIMNIVNKNKFQRQKRSKAGVVYPYP